MKFTQRHVFLASFTGVAAAFALGVFGGVFFSDWRATACRNTFSFINAKLTCDYSPVIKKTGYGGMRSALSDFIEEEKKAGRAEIVSVYFRDLVEGPILGINENVAFAPASLLKLPLALVFMSQSEAEPEVLEKKIHYTGTTTSVGGQFFKPEKSIEPGKVYTIEELLGFMLRYSDNASYDVLEQFLANDAQRLLLREEVFQEIGIINPKDKVENTITTRNYASLFRILYNVAYLNAENAEKVLNLLAGSGFDQGLKSGVPVGVRVSHKFGERFTSDGKKQLHDCGIVYFPENPYLLCIMTRGDDFEMLLNIIQQISRMIHEEVNQRRI